MVSTGSTNGDCTRAELEEAAEHHMHPMAIEGDGEHHAIEPEPEEEHHLAK